MASLTIGKPSRNGELFSHLRLPEAIMINQAPSSIKDHEKHSSSLSMILNITMVNLNRDITIKTTIPQPLNITILIHDQHPWAFGNSIGESPGRFGGIQKPRCTGTFAARYSNWDLSLVGWMIPIIICHSDSMGGSFMTCDGWYGSHKRSVASTTSKCPTGPVMTSRISPRAPWWAEVLGCSSMV